jgi:hypothetical protein
MRTAVAPLALVLFSGGALADHISHDEFVIGVHADQENALHAPYDRHLTQYHPTVGWVDGDREAYNCAYMFLIRDSENPSSEVLGRVTFKTIDEAAAYTVVNDRFMEEGVRRYDGTYDPGSGQFNYCRRLDTEAYEPLEGDPGVPRIEFSDAASGQTLEVRDYTRASTQQGQQGTWCCGEVAETGPAFKIVSATPDQVTVVGYKDRLPFIAVYYDRMSPNIRLTSNFDESKLSPSLSSSPSPDTGPDPEPLTADFDGDGDVDYADLWAFIEAWIEEFAG